jgi:hypothetical protein
MLNANESKQIYTSMFWSENITSLCPSDIIFNSLERLKSKDQFYLPLAHFFPQLHPYLTLSYVTCAYKTSRTQHHIVETLQNPTWTVR